MKTTIDCDEAEMDTAALFDGELSHDQKRQLADHFRHCAGCRETFLSLAVDGVEEPLSRLADALQLTVTRTSRADGQVLGLVTYTFTSEAQRDAFIAGRWP